MIVVLALEYLVDTRAERACRSYKRSMRYPRNDVSVRTRYNSPLCDGIVRLWPVTRSGSISHR